MSAGRGNRPLILGDGVPSTGSQNLAAGSGPAITGPTLLSGCSTSMMNATHEGSAPRAAPQGSMSSGSGAQQDAGPSTRASCSLPAGCTQVPISILVFHRRLTGRGSRPRVPRDSEAAPSIQLPPNDFLSLGRASNDVASETAMNPSAQATPVSCNSEHPFIHSQLNGLDAEAPNTRIQGDDSQLPSSSSSSAAAVICDVHSKLESAIPASTDETQGQHTKQLIELLGEGVTDHNMHNYQRTPKRPKTQLKQNYPTVVLAPASFKERTPTQIEIQIPSTEKVETFQSEDTPVRKAKPRRKKLRAKVIREDKPGKKQNSAVTTPEEMSLNQKTKRRYVRKKRNLSSLEKCSGPVTDQPISRGTENATRSRTASVRRRLQFELGEQGVQGDQSSTGNSCQHHEKLAHAKSSLCSMTRSAVQIGHGLQAEMENLPGGLVFGMTHKLNELLDDYIHLPEITPKPSQEISPATSGCLSREPAGKQENVGSTHDPDTTRMGETIMEGNNKDLGVKYSNIDGFDMHHSVTSIPETEYTESQATKVSKLDEKEHVQHRQSDSSLTDSQDSIILRTAAEMLAFCQAGGVKKKRSVRARRNSFVPIMDAEKHNSQALTRLPQSCMEALYESSCIKFTAKKRSWKERLSSTSSIRPNMDKKNIFSSESIFSGGSNVSKGSEGTFQQTLPQAPDNRRIKLDIDYEVPERSSEHTSTVYMDYLQEVAARLEQLDLNTEHVHRTEIHPSLTTSSVVSFRATGGLSNSLVPYSGIPYERPLHLIKKQRPRAKVNLDDETTRVWNLLMGKATEPVDGTDVDKERFWEKEREVFQGRANSFIARMRLVQGDRHFSPWKGSVVDSVVGVFLTQNVSDHLSSSAYMALAASYPPGSVGSNCKDDIISQDNEEIISTSTVGDISRFDFFGSAARSDLEANEGFCIHQETEIDHRAHQFLDFSLIELSASARNLPEEQSQKDMSSSESVTISKTVLQTQLSLSAGKNCTPRYFVGGVDSADFQQMRSNFNGNSLAGNDAATNELECRRTETGAINDNSVGEHAIPSNPVIYPFISVDNRQPDVTNEPYVSSTSHKSSADSASAHPKSGVVEEKFPLFMPFDNHMAQMNYSKTVTPTLTTPETSTDLPVELQYDKRTSFEASGLHQHESLSVTGGDGMIADTASMADESTLRSGFISHNAVPDKAAQASKQKKTRTTNKKNMENFDWDKFRRQAYDHGHMNERSFERRDSVNWEAVRCADVQRISRAIQERGMNNVLAERIQNFLKRLVRDHGSIDLEWLRDIPADSAKDYLLSIRGLGLKSVECVRLLTLHHLAFPVDTNVGRICVRLGWVPIQPLPESLQLHLLELYPVLETIQKYLWPRLCKLDQQTLYELHYQMITFGKVFCTKSKPNCNACPMRSECKHFASAFASARLALPAPEEKSLVKSSNQFSFENGGLPTRNSTVLPQLEGRDFPANNSEPIVEEPASPREEECPETLVNDIEDYDADTGEIPTIKLNMETFARNLENCIKESNKDLQFGDIAKALVAISTQAASIPAPKLKNVHRLRTEHYVYELPDSHSLVQQLELDQREPDDPSPYLLTIWMEDDIKEMNKAPKSCCEMEAGFCNNECHYCVPERENQSRYVRGTILVPCRTAMKGSFPLNGTYFQVNEVFADHKSSHDPIYVAREQLWNLQRRMVYFGTSVPSIFKGLTTEQVQQCFWRGFVCVRGFDMETRAPRPLCPHLHLAASKLPRSRMTAQTAQNSSSAKTAETGQNSSSAKASVL